MLVYPPLLLMSHSHNVFVCDDAAIYARPCFTRNHEKKDGRLRSTRVIAAPSARDVLTHKLVPPIHAPDATYPNALVVIVFLGQVQQVIPLNPHLHPIRCYSSFMLKLSHF